MSDVYRVQVYVEPLASQRKLRLEKGIDIMVKDPRKTNTLATLVKTYRAARESKNSQATFVAESALAQFAPAEAAMMSLYAQEAAANALLSVKPTK